MKDMDLICFIAYVAVLIGGIVLGLDGLFGFNLFTAILGGFMGRILCIAIGGAAGYLCYRFYLDKFKR